MADIFISYKREEADTAENLANTLEQLGFSVWWDVGLLAGDEFREVIREMIDKSKVVIVLWSPLAVMSKFVVDEATHAQRQDKLLPVILADCELPFGFGSHHADNLSSWDGQISHKGFSRLLQSIERTIDKKARFGGNQGSTPSQKAEMAAFQTVAKLDSKAAWVKFLNDYPGTSFRGFIETHIGEVVEVSKKQAPIKKAKPATKKPNATPTKTTKTADTPPKNDNVSGENPPNSKKGLFIGLGSIAAIAIASIGYFALNNQTKIDAPIQTAQPEKPAQDVNGVEAEAWASARQQNSVSAFQAYLKDHNNGAHSVEARTRISDLETTAMTERDNTSFAIAIRDGSVIALGEYVAKFQNGIHKEEADRGAWIAALGEGNQQSYQSYLSYFPDGKYAPIAKTNLGIQDTPRSTQPQKEALKEKTLSPAEMIARARAEVAGIVDKPVNTAPKVRDCNNCPQMVIIPAGRFTMGDISGEGGNDELPIHAVTIEKSFSVAKYETTFDQWDACVNDGGCTHTPSDNGWGRGTRPVINVSWDDSQQYIQWISQKTGSTYKLLSEAEWEYIARAGTETKYFWGNEPGSNNANCSRCGSEWDGEQTAPVGSFTQNSFGVYDMHANVYEWVQDCWFDNYNNASNTATPAPGGDCSRHAIRGGSWSVNPKGMRAANRSKFKSDFRDAISGFRVARVD